MSPTPIVSSKWTARSAEDIVGDIYVSKSGSDSNIGTKESPFLTIEKAIQELSTIDRTGRDNIVVSIESGSYHINNINLGVGQSGTEDCQVIFTSSGGNVVLNAGVQLKSSDFVSVQNYPDIASRIQKSVLNKVFSIDLKKAPYNLTKADWGELYPIGTYNTADRYQGDTTGIMHGELFINNDRQTLARYPNAGYIKTGKVISCGKDVQAGSNGDPAGDIFNLGSSLTTRVQSWKNLDNVWLYGFWQYDWADGSTPIANFDSGNLTTKYQSFFGVKEGAPYYFYNCLEELDEEGEWYLDRESGILSIYKPTNFDTADINFSTSTSSAITINSNFITLQDLIITGTRMNGIEISGNGNVVDGCTITSIGGHAINVLGTDNAITKNEICAIGKSGISVIGGDRTTLTAGNNIVDNNLVHDWAEVFKIYQAGINFGGVGNICSHNELYNSPHLAITYDGNNHIFEYNLIRDVCLEVDDGGAIYAGRSWSSYGNDIRYNLIYNLGSEGFSPNGIYMDDAISGQNIYGNILINIPKHAIFIGGGRDMVVYDNLIINAKNGAIRYDARAIQGIKSDMWFSEHVDQEKGDLWRDLRYSPWKSEMWQTAFPQYKNISDDFSNIDNEWFMANPSGSIVKNNIVFDKNKELGEFDQEVSRYSSIDDNEVYYLFGMKKYFRNYTSGDYKINDRSRFDSSTTNSINMCLDGVGRY